MLVDALEKTSYLIINAAFIDVDTLTADNCDCNVCGDMIVRQLTSNVCYDHSPAVIPASLLQRMKCNILHDLTIYLSMVNFLQNIGLYSYNSFPFQKVTIRHHKYCQISYLDEKNKISRLFSKWVNPHLFPILGQFHSLAMPS